MSVSVTNVKISAAGKEISGYFARPDHGGAFPGVVVIQEWWGLNDHIKDITGRLAAEGFAALAPDLYDGKVTRDPNEAGALMQGLDENVAVQKLSAAVDFLKIHPEVARHGVGVIGFCMGGSLALLMACKNKNVSAATPFYGKVPDDTAMAQIAAPVLYIYAGKDQWITRAEVDRLDGILKKAGNKGQVVRYPDADHAFFNDTRKEVYKKDDAEDAWKRAVTFLKANIL